MVVRGGGTGSALFRSKENQMKFPECVNSVGERLHVVVSQRGGAGAPPEGSPTLTEPIKRQRSGLASSHPPQTEMVSDRNTFHRVPRTLRV